MSTINQLNKLVASSVDFYFTYKFFHWNITAQDFPQFHALFDSHASTIYESIDTIAERIRQIDGEALSSLPEFNKLSIITPHAINPKNNLQEILKFLLAQHQGMITLLEEIIKSTSEQDDYSTADILTEFLEQEQKMAWFIRSSVV